MRRGLLVCLLSLCLAAAPSRALAQGGKKPEAGATAAPQDLIAKGQTLFDDQQYEESIQALSAALLRPSNTQAQKVEIYRLLALNYITLGRSEEADAAVRGLLVAEPAYRLPAAESPRFREFFAKARERWESEGRPGLAAEPAPKERPVVLSHRAPSSADAGQPIELRGKLDDPEGRAAGAKIWFRTGSRGEFESAPADVEESLVRTQIPASSVKPPVVDYYVEVLDADGNVIASRGDAQAPLRIAVTEKSNGWVLPVAIGGGILGAAAIVGGLALAGVFSSSSSGRNQGMSNVSIQVTDASVRF
jgi:tetratricopeptide (TPR) repeat protein